MTLRPTATPSLTRRQWLGLTVGGAFGGAAWATGLGVLARGVHPQIYLMGADGWQVVLIEHGSARLVLLLGHFSREPGPGIDFMATSLRQHVDVIAGERSNLDLLDWEHPKWSQATRIVLGEITTNPVSGREVTLSDELAVTVGDWAMRFSQDSREAWKKDSKPTCTWVVQATCQSIGITFGNDLRLAATHREPATALLVAPSAGTVDPRADGIPASVAVNSDALDEVGLWNGESDSPYRLTRVFPGDIASFRVTDGRLTIPDWSTQL